MFYIGINAEGVCRICTRSSRWDFHWSSRTLSQMTIACRWHNTIHELIPEWRISSWNCESLRRAHARQARACVRSSRTLSQMTIAWKWSNSANVDNARKKNWKRGFSRHQLLNQIRGSAKKMAGSAHAHGLCACKNYETLVCAEYLLFGGRGPWFVPKLWGRNGLCALKKNMKQKIHIKNKKENIKTCST